MSGMNGNGAPALGLGGLGGGPGGLGGGSPFAFGQQQRLRKLDVEDLKTWMRDVSAPERKAERCLVFALEHEHDERGREAVGLMGTIDSKAKPAEREEAIGRIASMIDRHSWAIAGRAPRGQSFYVGAAMTTEPNEHALTTYPFTVDPPPEIARQFHQRGVGGEASEANLGAVVGHLQRLVDRFADKLDNLVDKFVTENDRLRAHNEALYSSRWEMTVKHEQLADEHALRTVKVEQARAEMALTNEVKLELTRFLMQVGKQYVRSKWGGTPAEQDGKIIASLKRIAPPSLLKLAAAINELPEEERGDLDPVFQRVIEDMPPETRNQVLALMDEEHAKQAAIDEEAARKASAIPTDGKVSG